MASPDVSQLVSTLALGVQQERLVKGMMVPGLALVVFDWLLTLDLEVSLVWNAPWGGMKPLFLLTRYLPFIDISIAICYFSFAFPQRRCQILFQVFAWMFTFGHFFAGAILTLRTWAVCGKTKSSTYKLFSAYGLVVASVFILAVLYLRVSTSEASPAPQLFGCLLSIASGSSYLASAYAVMALYEGGLLLVMIKQGVSTIRVAGGSRLVKVVYRDGILYYLCIVCLSLLSTVVILKFEGARENMMLATLARAVHSIAACRVVLNIRQQGEMTALGQMPSEQITGPLRFAQTNSEGDGGP